jgi:1,4-dihydroxy-2-naphthoate octaprenyltransferase
VVGSGVAFGYGHFSLWRGALALIVALALQVGVNYANDYSDGIRGTDEVRVGPLRLVATGVAPPRQVRDAALGCFAVACVAGLVLAAVTSWWLVLLGAAAVAAAWTYTGGRHPYGYHGLGEIAVFAFFGLAAVAGTAFVEMDSLPWLALAASLPVGLLACALLVITTCGTSRPTRRRASAPWPSSWVTRGPGRCTSGAWWSRSWSRHPWPWRGRWRCWRSRPSPWPWPRSAPSGTGPPARP